MSQAPGGARMRAILHPTDLTAGSDQAFAHALRIALAGRMKFYVLHAASGSQAVDWDAFPAARRTLARWGELPSDSDPAAVAERLGVQLVKLQIPERDSVKAILHFLDDHSSDLIVLATHGREGLPRFLQRSVAEPVARQAFTPTLFIPHGARGFVDSERGAVQLRRVLVPIDGRPRPEDAVRTAWQLCRLLGQEPTFDLLYVGDEGEMPAVQLPDDLSAPTESLIRAGEPVEEILSAASEGSADLIVMATAGRQGFLDAFRGSTTERVLRQAPCPLLAVPSA
jgi:nucleotide-binding universal stress UspA family protein